MTQILNTVIPVIIIIGVGLIIGKIKRGINLELIVNLIFYIASPSYNQYPLLSQAFKQKRDYALGRDWKYLSCSIVLLK